MIRHPSKFQAALLAGLSGFALLSVDQATVVAAPSASSARPADHVQATAGRCEALQNAGWKDFEIESAKVRPANSRDALAPGVDAPAQLPAFCRVIAHARPSPRSDIKFEVWLPTSGWDGRLSTAGNGGLAGYISYSPGLVDAVRAGQVGMSTDTGHTGTPNDGDWAKGEPEKVTDYGWRALHVTTVAAKAIVQRFYGQKVRNSYFASCSNGGRQALMEASRFPDDYDGIIAGAPVWSWTGQALTQIWNEQSMATPGALIQTPQIAFLQGEVRRQCGKDRSGFLTDPRSCTFDAAKLECGVSQSPACFSKQQVDFVRRVYSGPQASAGKALWWGFVPSGAEVGSGPYQGWSGWIVKTDNGQPTLQSVFPRHFLSSFRDHPFTDIAHFDFDHDVTPMRAGLSSPLDVTPDFRKFFARGGKMILWHGWADPAVPPGSTIELNRRIAELSGNKKSRRSTRLFLVPGVQHCFGGPGPNNLGQVGAPLPSTSPQDSMIAALQAWVERGRSPDWIVGTHDGKGLGYEPANRDAKSRRQTIHAEGYSK